MKEKLKPFLITSFIKSITNYPLFKNEIVLLWQFRKVIIDTKMKFSLQFLFSFWCLQSCSLNTLKIGTLPENFDRISVGCFFNEKGKEKDIFQSGYEEEAYMFINGKLEKFKENLPNENNIWEYSNENYKVWAKVKEIQELETGGWYEGKITIKNLKK